MHLPYQMVTLQIREKTLEYFAALDFPGFSPFVFVIPKIDLGIFAFGPLPIRWYAVSYIIGVALSFYYGTKLIARPKLYGGVPSPVSKDDMDEVLTWALLGGILGGRIGYLLFYRLPHADARAVIADDPMSLLRIWEGGLSFHGGFIGVCLAIFLVARARKIPLWSFADVWAMIAPITVFSVRVFGNFLNAELYGRHTDSSLGMVFPEGVADANYGPPIAYDVVDKAWVYCRDNLESIYCAAAEMPRHPSQIYEGVLEGLIPGLILAFLAWRYKILEKPGLATGLFFIMYGIGRSIVENFRQPDEGIGFIFGEITTGMILSTPIWLIGGWLIWNALKHKPLSAPE